MFSSKIFWALIYLYVNLSYCEDTNVRFVAIIFRHGDRTPIQPYPTDPWGNESLWPVKFGQLTNTGKRQLYALGKWLNERYSHLVPEIYDPAQFQVNSTDVDRTLMSALVLLAGFFPPMKYSLWNPLLKWQPTPVHTVPEKYDDLLAMKKTCPAYDEEYQKLTDSQEYKDQLNVYGNLMDFVSVCSGEQITGYNDLNDIYSTLFIENLYNFTLPRWTTSIFPDKLKEPACYSFIPPTGTQKLARLKVGPLLDVIVGNIYKAISEIKSGGENTLKISMYSGHDITVANVLNALDLFDGNCPVYTATVIIELIYDTATNTPFVRILYRNSTEIIEPYNLRIPYCGKFCPVERFVRLYDKLLNVDWDKECQLVDGLKETTLEWGLKLFTRVVFVGSIVVICVNHFANIFNQDGLVVLLLRRRLMPAA